MDQGLKDKLNLKHVLLDTGVVIRAFEHFEEFEVFFKELENINCTAVQFPFIEFEFLRGAYDFQHRKERKEFLNELTPACLESPREETIQSAISIANCYSARKHYSASLTDCCIASFLKKYNHSLFLITLNHKDFPKFLFDRIGVIPIDTEQDIFTLGIYQFNKDKAKKIGC